MNRKIGYKLDGAFKDVIFEDFYTELPDGSVFYNKSLMVQYLLNEGVLFLNSRKYLDLNKEICPETLVLFVLCSDYFCPGSDSEEVTMKELPDLCKAHIEAPKGIIEWVAKKRSIPCKSWNEK